MQNKDVNYYKKSASFLGWGVKSAKLNEERINLLDKFIVGKKVLDIGCGLGLYTDYLSRNGFEVCGVDLVGDFIKQAQKTKNGVFIKGKAEKLPFEDNFFDTTLLFDILEHGDDKKILNETKRVTKKRILLIVPRAVDKELANSGVVFRHYIDKSHLREYKQNDLIELADKLGFKVIHIQPVHPLYNETVFMALFNGPILLKKIIRKMILFLLPKRKYPTEYFAIFDIP